MRPPSPAIRLWCALTASVAIASLVLQYVLLLRFTPVTEGAAQATLRFLGYFTILSNLAVAAVCVARARGGRDGLSGPGARAAVAVYIGITGLVYALLLRTLWQPQGWQWWADSGLHYAVPVLYLLGWAFDRHGGLGWRFFAVALSGPLVYFGWVLVLARWTGQYPYPFLDVAMLGVGATLRNVSTLALAFVALAGLVWIVDHSLARR